MATPWFSSEMIVARWEVCEMRLIKLVPALIVATSCFLPAQNLFEAHSYPVPGNESFSIHDMNRDGASDIVLFGGGPSTTLAILFNDGHGGFGKPFPIPNAHADFAAVSDFNQDGLPDVAACLTSDSGSTVSLYLNHGGGSLQKIFSAVLRDSCRNVIAADINRDGRTDLIVPSVNYSVPGNWTSTLRTFFGNGTGSLRAPVMQRISLAAKNNPQHITDCALASGVGSILTSPSRTDLILYGVCAGDVASAGTTYYATSNIDGTYTLRELSESTVYSCGQGSTYVTDINGDGKPDVVTACAEDAPMQEPYVTAVQGLLNQGSGKFVIGLQAQSLCPGTYYCTIIQSGGGADFTGDHIFDSVFGYNDSQHETMTPKPRIVVINGATSQTVSWSVAAASTQIQSTDFNRDGRKDFAALSFGRFVVYLNGGYSCTAPATAGVHVCAPVATSTYSVNGSSSVPKVTVIAAGKAASGRTVNHMKIWVDGTQLNGSYAGSKLNTTISLSVGTHQLTMAEVDSSGTFVKSVPTTVKVTARWH